MSSLVDLPSSPIAMTIKAEPGWRVMLKKLVERPPESKDMPGEDLYTLRVMPIRFWGFTVPVFNEHLRRKLSVSDVLMAFRVGQESEYGKLAFTELITNVKPEQSIQPVPLGKSRKPYSHVIDVLDPNETDKQAHARIEAIFENEREVKRLTKVLYVMES